MELRVRSGGLGEPVVLLLHGLGATAEVWDGLVPLLPGAWVAPDLPGHGGSAPLPAYTFAAVAEAVATSWTRRAPWCSGTPSEVWSGCTLPRDPASAR
ncbi:hypothetical protein BJF90_30505 [Pseudonocardia sp. CNS-004]|nr:hypothetical protein BJF90_30505 [Pseudonocardia sp. CNS-004]